jgi:prepilin-type N-terminal cleavage/methylation domain-containing protein
MNRNKFLTRAQRGFTLVEIAIVLVIIGLLLGGVLKGQEMIENARIKSVVGDMNGISAAYNSYLDRYHAIPGDETNAVMGAAGRGWLGAAAGNGNGILDTLPAATFTNVALEQGAMWRALRASGLASGNPAAAVGVAGLPRSGTGGLMGVSVGPYGLGVPSVCITGLTAKQAAGIDNAIDGAGATNNTGTVRGSNVNPLIPADVTPPAIIPYNETNPALWTLCKPL